MLAKIGGNCLKTVENILVVSSLNHFACGVEAELFGVILKIKNSAEIKILAVKRSHCFGTLNIYLGNQPAHRYHKAYTKQNEDKANGIDCTRTGLRIDSKADVSAGDGVCIINRGEIYGTNVNGVQGDVIEPNRRDGVEVGAELYRNYDHRFSLQLDRSRTQRKISAVAEVRLQAEGVLLRVTDCDNFSVVVERKLPLEQANDAEKMRQTLIRQVTKSGGTIFSVTDVDVSGEEYFVAASVVSDMRREALEALRLKRINTPLPHRILQDTGEARYPSESISRYENVINHLSRRFYERHGVKHFEQALETMPTQGERVMVSSYCIRREIGECLKCGSKLRGELYIEHGTARYRLDFDCKRCMMSLTDCSRLDRKKTE